MTVVDPSINLQLIALDYVYGGPRRSLLGSKPNRLVLAIIGCHLLLTTFLASRLNLWIDEAYSLAATNHDLPTTFKWAIGFEEQAPFYFILLWFTRHIHDSVLIARLPSLLTTAATLWLSSRISQKLFPMVHRGWIVLALAFNPFIIAIALEARGYAWTVFLSTLLLWLFIKGYANSLLEPSASRRIARPFIPLQNQPWARWAYGATAVIALYSHYFLAFQIAAQGIVLLLIALGSVERRKRTIASLEAYCLASMIIIILTLPIVLLISQQLTDLKDNSTILDGPSAIAALQAALSQTLFRNLVYLLPSDPAGTTGWTWKLGRILVGLWLLALAWGRRRHLRFNVTFAWLIHGLVTLQLLAAFALVQSVEYRHAIVMVLLCYFSVLGLISLLPRTRRRLLLSFSLILLLCLNARSLWQVYSPMAKPGDYARVGAYLQQVVASHEPVVVFNGEVAMALEHYYPSSPNRDSSGEQKPFAGSPEQENSEEIVPPSSTVITLPRSLFNPHSKTIPQYREANLILTSSEQIEQALSLNPTPKQQATLHQNDLASVPKDRPSPFNKSVQQTIPIIEPAKAKLENRIRLMKLTPEAKAQIREAMDLPTLKEQISKSSAPSSVKAFLDNLDKNNLALGSKKPELLPNLWLVRDDHSLPNMVSFDESYRLLDNFMDQNYRLLNNRQFHGTQVQQWQRLPKEFAPITES